MKSIIIIIIIIIFIQTRLHKMAWLTGWLLLYTMICHRILWVDEFTCCILSTLSDLYSLHPATQSVANRFTWCILSTLSATLCGQKVHLVYSVYPARHSLGPTGSPGVFCPPCQTHSGANRFTCVFCSPCQTQSGANRFTWCILFTLPDAVWCQQVHLSILFTLPDTVWCQQVHLCILFTLPDTVWDQQVHLVYSVHPARHSLEPTGSEEYTDVTTANTQILVDSERNCTVY